jgi:hypothetical protein
VPVHAPGKRWHGATGDAVEPGRSTTGPAELAAIRSHRNDDVWAVRVKVVAYLPPPLDGRSADRAEASGFRLAAGALGGGSEMSTTDFFLFPLSFLVSGLLAGWIWYLGRERDSFSGYPPVRARDGELVRLTESLASVLNRVEALERRHEELLRKLDGRAGTHPDPAEMSASAAGGTRPARVDGTATARERRVDGTATARERRDEGTATARERCDGVQRRREAEAGGQPMPGRGSETPEQGRESEVSESQWRSAMDRLGPVWRSGSRLTDPGPRATAVEHPEVAGRREPEPSPSSSRRGAPLDDLFPPPASFGKVPRLRETEHEQEDGGRTTREPEHTDRIGPGNRTEHPDHQDTRRG